jgi:hypothetical protein
LKQFRCPQKHPCPAGMKWTIRVVKMWEVFIFLGVKTRNVRSPLCFSHLWEVPLKIKKCELACFHILSANRDVFTF